MSPFTQVTRASLSALYAVPTERKGDRDFLNDIVVWVWCGDNHQEIRPGPGIPTACKVWWKGMILNAELRVQFPNADRVEFRYQQEPVWVVAVRAGNRREFTFSQDFTPAKPKAGYLAAG